MLTQHDRESSDSTRYQRVGVSVSPTPRCESLSAGHSPTHLLPTIARVSDVPDNTFGLGTGPSRSPRTATLRAAVRWILIRFEHQESPIKPA